MTYAGLAQCGNCGETGVHVEEATVWIGGQGYVRVMRCDNAVACSERQDAKQREAGHDN